MLWCVDQVGEPTGAKPWQQVAAGSTIGASRIIALGQPGHGQFVPGSTCQSSCDGAMKNVFGVRFVPTISTGSDGLVHVAELAAFYSNKTRT